MSSDYWVKRPSISTSGIQNWPGSYNQVWSPIPKVSSFAPSFQFRKIPKKHSILSNLQPILEKSGSTIKSTMKMTLAARLWAQSVLWNKSQNQKRRKDKISMSRWKRFRKESSKISKDQMKYSRHKLRNGKKQQITNARRSSPLNLKTNRWEIMLIIWKKPKKMKKTLSVTFQRSSKRKWNYSLKI